MDTQKGGLFKPQGFRKWDEPEWKSQRNSIEDPEKKCPVCGGLNKSTSSLCKNCGSDPVRNREFLRKEMLKLRQQCLELCRYEVLPVPFTWIPTLSPLHIQV